MPIAGSGDATDPGEGGPALDAGLATPVAVDFDVDGTLYIAEVERQCVRAVTPDGTIRVIAGTTLSGFGGDGAPEVRATLSAPAGLDRTRPTLAELIAARYPAAAWAP